jgi:septal ring factor EnvC (AmiA/AmiB activator)
MHSFVLCIRLCRVSRSLALEILLETSLQSEGQLEEARRALADKDTEIAAQQGQLVRKGEEVWELQQMNGHLMRSSEDLQASFREAQRRGEELRACLEDSRRECDGLSRQLADTQQVCFSYVRCLNCVKYLHAFPCQAPSFLFPALFMPLRPSLPPSLPPSLSHPLSLACTPLFLPRRS